MMRPPSLATLRFVRGWLKPSGFLWETEVPIPGLGSAPERLGTLILPPPGENRRLPGWVALHGITRTGRHHPSLLRFARALASTGAVVLLPEVPRWRQLELAPEETRPTLEAALNGLSRHPRVDPRRMAAVGFSFGAPQTLAAALHPTLAPKLRGVAAFGGYAHLDSTLEFQFTGRHHWEGQSYRLPPDPYGRWVVGSRYLTKIPGLEDRTAVAHALWTLAAHAGDLDIPSWDGKLDVLKNELASELRVEDRSLFRLFAPPAMEWPDNGMVREFLPLIVSSARATDPLLDVQAHPWNQWPPESLPGESSQPRIHLMHGRGDMLIPFSETHRMAQLLKEYTPRVDITELFSHSHGQPGPRGLSRRMGASVRFLRAVGHLLSLPDPAVRPEGEG
ncbi:MAG: hypothetical protein WEA09_03395 [Gemmatimonadota bacterium]